MPRTKITKNTKRNRDNADEEEINAVLKEFDMEVEAQRAKMEEECSKNLEKITKWVNSRLNLLPVEYHHLTFDEYQKRKHEKSSEMENMESTFAVLNATCMSAKRPTRNSDDGYITESASSTTSSHHHVLENITNKSIIGTNKKPVIRRSNSQPQLSHTPLKSSLQVPLLTSKKNRMTPMAGAQTIHSSRSKFRTPMTQNRIKAVSADRMITPKFSGDEPSAMLRYANVGETVVSLTGSPLAVPGQSISKRPNINIPMHNGMLMIQPTDKRTFLAEYIDRIDTETLNHLKILSKNLQVITKMAEGRRFE